MSSKRLNLGSRDHISGLPDCLISHVLSFLSTKEAASTSVLAKRWRYLFALTPNLDFNDSDYLNPDQKKITAFPWIARENRKTPRSFVDFVDRALVLHQDVPLNRFSLKCEDVIHPAIVIGWLLKVMERGVLDLDLNVSSEMGYPLPSEMFCSETLVRLKLGIRDVLTIDKKKGVFLPKVTTLCLDYIIVKNSVFAKLLSGCHALQELVLNNLFEAKGSCSVFHNTLERLVVHRSRTFDENHESVSFDTPNLVYLDYSDTIANMYPKVEFKSLVEASVDLRMTSDQIVEAKFSNDDRSPPEEMVGNATNFLMGICNVKILYLSDDTLEVLTYCCKPIPQFNNLIHLTIKTDPDVAWESLPVLLKNCPKLETLVFEGLHHKINNCGEEEGCLCKPWEGEDIPTCLSSSPVKILKILKFGDIFGDEDMEEQIKQVKYFLETMPKLEQLTLYYDTSYDEDVNEVSAQLQWLPRVASPKCKITVISDTLCLSSTVPCSVVRKWGRLL